MTDTVNVPRDPTLGMIHAAERVGSALAGSDASSGEITAAVWAAMLAAAPKAEPAGDSVDKVMGVLNYWFDGTARVRRDADMVKQLAALIDNAQPEAPKVEQEPAAIIHLEENHTAFGSFPVLASWKNNARLPAGKHSLYTRPAPASDELLKVIKHQEKLLRAICDAPQPEYVEGHLYNAIHNVNSYVAGLNAKHKGPQS